MKCVAPVLILPGTERERKDGADKLNLSGSGSGFREGVETGLVSMLCCATGGLTPISAKNIRAAAADRATKTKRRSILGSNIMMTN